MTHSILVRVSPDILAHLKTNNVAPVVILGVVEQPDGTHDMTLKTPDIVAAYRLIREAAEVVVSLRERWVNDLCEDADVDSAIDALQVALER